MVLQVFLALSTVVADRIESRDVRERWHRPSALDGYTTAGLAGHLARAVLTADRYVLGSTAPQGANLTDAVGYLVTVLADHDPHDSEFHAAIRARGAEAAQDGPEELSAKVRAATQRLGEQVDRAVLQRPVEVLDGVALSVEEYLRTRVVELVVHLDDLAVSVGSEPDEVPEAAYRLVAGVLAEVAAVRAGGLATVRSLARRERHPEAIRAL